MLDLDALHVLLTIEAGAGRVLCVNQTELAETLCTSKYTVHRALQAMERQGRITKLPGRAKGSHSYEVMHPKTWLAARTATAVVPVEPT